VRDSHYRAGAVSSGSWRSKLVLVLDGEVLRNPARLRAIRLTERHRSRTCPPSPFAAWGSTGRESCLTN